MPTKTDTYVNKEELAQKLKVSTRTLERWIKRRLLPYYKVRRSVRFDVKAVLECLNRNNLVVAR